MSQLLNALKTIDQTADADAVAIPSQIAPQRDTPSEAVTTPESPAAVEETVEETVEQVGEQVGDAIYGNVSVELPEGPDIVWPPGGPPTAIEENEPAAAPQVDDPPTAADDDLASQHASAAVPHVPATFTADDETLQLCDRILSQTPVNRSATIGLFRTGATRSSRRVVRQLAAAVSIRTGQPVLVIDTDWQAAYRSPADAGDGPPGLGEVLLEEVKWSEAIVEVGRSPAKVSFLNPGRRIASPVAGSRFGLLIDEVRPHYRYILIDGGRADGGSFAAEAAYCDRTYLVLGLDQTDRREALLAASALSDAGLDVAGCIVTYAA